MFAALAISALLQLQAAAPAAVDERAAFAAQVATLRQRWLAGLDAGAWDRDRPEVRALAEALTAEAVQLRAVRPPGAVEELDGLLGELGGASLLSLARERPVSHARWIPGLLRAHGEVAADLLTATTLERDVLPAAALWAPMASVPYVLTQLDAARAGLGCRAALLLSERARRRVEQRLPGELAELEAGGDPSCAALVASTERTRAGALAWLGRDVAAAQRAMTGGGYVIGTAYRASGFAHDAVTARNVLAVALAAERTAVRVIDRLVGVDAAAGPRDDIALRNAVDAVSTFAPYLRATAPTVGALRRVALAAEGGGWTATVTRMRWRDPSLGEDALAVLASPGTRDLLALASVRVVGITTADEPEPLRVAQLALTHLAQHIGGGEHPTLDEASLARWSEALAAPPCNDDRCLAELFATATDERAARAVWALGPRRLGSLAPAVAAALVARVVRRGRSFAEPSLAAPGALWSATSWAVFASVEGCPAALRGLREAGRPDEVDAVVNPWRDAFVRACRDADAGAPR